ncbi:hypothetical protein Emag_005693 [Eimeria magna]
MPSDPMAQSSDLHAASLGTSPPLDVTAPPVAASAAVLSSGDDALFISGEDADPDISRVEGRQQNKKASRGLSKPLSAALIALLFGLAVSLGAASGLMLSKLREGAPPVGGPPSEPPTQPEPPSEDEPFTWPPPPSEVDEFPEALPTAVEEKKLQPPHRPSGDEEPEFRRSAVEPEGEKKEEMFIAHPSDEEISEQIREAVEDTEEELEELEEEVEKAEGGLPEGRPEGEGPVIEPEGKAPVIEPKGVGPVIEPEGKAPVIEPEGKAPVIEPEGKAPVIEPEGKAPVIEPGPSEAISRGPDDLPSRRESVGSISSDVLGDGFQHEDLYEDEEVADADYWIENDFYEMSDSEDDEILQDIKKVETMLFQDQLVQDAAALLEKLPIFKGAEGEAGDLAGLVTLEEEEEIASAPDTVRQRKCHQVGGD